MPALNRRSFLAAASATLATPAIAGAPTSTGARRRRDARAKNVIFLVSDGMSTGTLTLADMAIQRERGRRSHWVSLFERDAARRSICTTNSANSLVTDSAAGASAWAIGRKVNNGSISVLPDSTLPEPILVSARNAGLATGLVTTTRVTHATPAAFIASVPKRSMEDAVAEQILDRGVDVVLGGGARQFKDEMFRSHADVHRVDDLASLRASSSHEGRLLGTFKKSHMSFEPDRPDTEPSLAQMTGAAIDRLARHPGGFVMQVEGGRVDHAAHANDATALVRDQIAFDDAVGAALEFADARDDTLVVVTTDHGNANPGLTLYGDDGNDGFDRLLASGKSYEWIGDQLEGTDKGADAIRDVVKRGLGVDLPTDDADWIADAYAQRRRRDGFHPASGTTQAMGAVLANHFGVAFLSPNHTSDMVEVTAIGPGADALAPACDNTDLYRLVTRAVRIAAG